MVGFKHIKDSEDEAEIDDQNEKHKGILPGVDENRKKRVGVRIAPEDNANEKDEETANKSVDRRGVKLALPPADLKGQDKEEEGEMQGRDVGRRSVGLPPSPSGLKGQDDEDTGDRSRGRRSVGLPPPSALKVQDDDGDTGDRGRGRRGVVLPPPSALKGQDDDEDAGDRGKGRRSVGLPPSSALKGQDDDEDTGDRGRGRRGVVLPPPSALKGQDDDEDTGDRGRGRKSAGLPPPSALKGQDDDEDAGDRGKGRRSAELPPPLALKGQDDDEDTGDRGRGRRGVELPPPLALKGQDDDEDTGDRGRGRRGVGLPPPSALKGQDDDEERGIGSKGGGGRGIMPPLNLDYLRGLSGLDDDEEESDLSEDEEEEQTDSSEKTLPKKTLADIVMLAMSAEARKKRHAQVSDKVTGISFNLSELEKIGIICVLEDCVDILHILERTNSKPPVTPELQFVSLKDKFADREKLVIDVGAIDGKPESSREYKKIVKLQRERGILEMILKDTLEDLKSDESFKTLAEIIQLERQQKMEEERLYREEEDNREEVNKLQLALRFDLKESTNALNEKIELIARLKDEYQDAYFMNNLRFSYVSHWETAREEQNSIRLETPERNYEKKLQDLKTNIDLENRCHIEIETYVKQTIAKLEDEIEKWMQRYDIELEDRADEIQRLRAKRAEHYTELEELALTYQHHQNEIDEYLVYKEKIAAEKAEEERINRAATKIQAWWRGLMVRLKLGPFQKKKKSKGKDKKGKGKGGKGGGKKKKK